MSTTTQPTNLIEQLALELAKHIAERVKESILKRIADRYPTIKLQDLENMFLNGPLVIH